VLDCLSKPCVVPSRIAHPPMLAPVEEPCFGKSSIAGTWQPNDSPAMCENCTLRAGDFHLFGTKLFPGVTQLAGGPQSVSFSIDTFLQTCKWTCGSLWEELPLDGSKKPLLLFACDDGNLRPNVQCISRSYAEIAWKLRLANDHVVLMKLSLDEGGKSATLQIEDSGQSTYRNMIRSELASAEVQGTPQKTRRPCVRDGCPFFATWHPTHCCLACENNGNHGPYCERSAKDGIVVAPPILFGRQRLAGPALASKRISRSVFGTERLPKMSERKDTNTEHLADIRELSKRISRSVFGTERPQKMSERKDTEHLPGIREVATVRASRFGCFGFRT